MADLAAVNRPDKRMIMAAKTLAKIMKKIAEQHPTYGYCTA